MKQARFECREAASNRLRFASPDWYSARRSVEREQGSVVIIDNELIAPGDDGVVWRSHAAPTHPHAGDPRCICTDGGAGDRDVCEPCEVLA